MFNMICHSGYLDYTFSNLSNLVSCKFPSLCPIASFSDRSRNSKPQCKDRGSLCQFLCSEIACFFCMMHTFEWLYKVLHAMMIINSSVVLTLVGFWVGERVAVTSMKPLHIDQPAFQSNCHCSAHLKFSSRT